MTEQVYFIERYNAHGETIKPYAVMRNTTTETPLLTRWYDGDNDSYVDENGHTWERTTHIFWARSYAEAGRTWYEHVL